MKNTREDIPQASHGMVEYWNNGHYPEERACGRPTVLQILRIFNSPERHALLKDGETVQDFPPQLTDIQNQIIGMLGIPKSVYG